MLTAVETCRHMSIELQSTEQNEAFQTISFLHELSPVCYSSLAGELIGYRKKFIFKLPGHLALLCSVYLQFLGAANKLFLYHTKGSENDAFPPCTWAYPRLDLDKRLWMDRWVTVINIKALSICGCWGIFNAYQTLVSRTVCRSACSYDTFHCRRTSGCTPTYIKGNFLRPHPAAFKLPDFV